MKNGKRASQHWQIAVMGALLASVAGCEFASSDELIRRDLEVQPERGKTLIFAFGCVACHRVNGVPSGDGSIGPPLTNWSRRKFIAGNLPNQPPMLIRWITNPQEVEPGTAMPDLGVTESEARDMAAYLYSQ